jgi:hypothetical protein
MYVFMSTYTYCFHYLVYASLLISHISRALYDATNDDSMGLKRVWLKKYIVIKLMCAKVVGI